MVTDLRAAQPATERERTDLDAIDAAIAATDLSPKQRLSDDIDPDSFEAQLRQVLPPKWTHFEVTGEDDDSGEIPTPVQAMLGAMGGRPAVVARVNLTPRGIAARWSTSEGSWAVAGHPCQGNSTLYHIIVAGPETKVSRDDLTVSAAMSLLRAVGAIE